MKLLYFISFFLCFEAYSNESSLFKIENLIRETQYLSAQKELDLATKLKEGVRSKLQGQIFFKIGKLEEAISSFKKAKRLGEKTDQLHLMLAQALLKSKQPSEASLWLNKVRKNSIQKDLLSAQVLWAQGKKFKALAYLSGLKARKYESYDLIERQKYYYLYELGLLSHIFKETKSYYKKTGNSPEAGLYAVSLIKSKDSYLAENYFDLLISLNPKSALILKERGVFELEKGRAYLASSFFSRAAHLNQKYSFEAASTLLSLGRHAESLFFNSKVTDDKKRVLQRFMIYLDGESYEQALSLKYDLERLDLTSKDNVTYALIYASFKTRDYKSLNSLFYKVTSKVYLSKALKLKNLFEACRKSLEPSCVFS